MWQLYTAWILNLILGSLFLNPATGEVYRVDTFGSTLAHRALSNHRQFFHKKDEKVAAGNSFNITDFYDFSIFGDLTIGTPSVKFTVEFSTASSTLIVINSSCTDANCVGKEQSKRKKARYDQSKSTTYGSDGRSFHEKHILASAFVEISPETQSL
uniref:Peptidase A1 domain-containing protein n=1 Tax=Ditylenchus dipsaci TaxID=166011 RepID=A0A915CPN9_9BILA